MLINGKRLRELRKEKKLTQEEVGNILGVSKAIICFYERGSRNPSLDNLVLLAKLYDKSLDYLMGFDYRVKTFSNEIKRTSLISEEEVIFIEELRKDPTVYSLLLDNPKRGAEVVRKRVG